MLGLKQLPQMFIPLSFALCFHAGVGGFVVMMQNRLNETPPVLLTSYEVVTMDAYGQENSNLAEADIIPIKDIAEIEETEEPVEEVEVEPTEITDETPPPEVVEETPPPIETAEITPDVSPPEPLEALEPPVVPKKPIPTMKTAPRPIAKPEPPIAPKLVKPAPIKPPLEVKKTTEVKTKDAKKLPSRRFVENAKIAEKTTQKPTHTIIGSKKAYIPPSSSRSYSQNKKPTYPSSARRRNMEGTVLLHVVISIRGTVKELSVIQSSKFKVLDNAALKAVKHWRFTPALRQGKPVEGSLNIPILFKLNK